MHKHNHQRRQYNLSEGLREHDLRDMVYDRFEIDQYKSKMGSDDEIIVISFKVRDKFPAIDMMEFIERGYDFVLDADMSTGEETDGNYSVFVELQRDSKLPDNLKKLLNGLSKLCAHKTWYFKYYKDRHTHEFSEEAINKVVPLDQLSYEQRMKEENVKEVTEFFDQGTADVIDIDENDNLRFIKPFAGDLTVKLESIGKYDDLINTLQGAIQLDESSNGQLLFLEKYLGNYEIYKIDNRFIIKNGDKAVIINKKDW